MSKQHLSPAEFAEWYAITTDRVGDMIRSGELRAVDVSTGRGKRPTWRISHQERERWELSRQSQPTAKPSRRRKRPSYLPSHYREIV